jgi:hypothetical protein
LFVAFLVRGLADRFADPAAWSPRASSEPERVALAFLPAVAAFLTTLLFPDGADAGAEPELARALALVRTRRLAFGGVVGRGGTAAASLNTRAAVSLEAALPAFPARVVNMSRALRPLLRSTPPRLRFRASDRWASPVMT